MNTHFTSERICRWIAGERKPGDERHLVECHACRAEVDQFTGIVDAFGTALRSSPAPPVRRAASRAAVPRWILVTAALSALIAAPVYWSVRQQRAAEQAKADELLLERVNAGLSRSVPASMEPLMFLVNQKETE